MSRNQRDLPIGANSNAAKMNGKPQANGKPAGKAGNKQNPKSSLDVFLDKLYDDNRKTSLSPQQQRRKVKEYLSGQMPGTSNPSIGPSESSSSEYSSEDQESQDSGSDDQESQDSGSDEQESSDCSSDSEEMTEYTMSSSSSPEIPPVRRTNEKAASQDANNNKVAPIKNKTAAEKAGPAPANPRIQRRVTMAGALVHTEPEATKSGALACPLKRKSVASCPLPAKAKSPNPTPAARSPNPTQAAKSKAATGAVVPPRIVQEDDKNKPGTSAGLAVPRSGRSKSKSPVGGKSSSKPGTSAGDTAAEGSSGAKSSTVKAAKAKSTGSAGDGDAAGDADGPSTSSAAMKKDESSKTITKDYHKVNSIEEGRRMLQWVINPLQSDEFFANFWEKNACQVQRQNPKYFSELISFRMIDEMLIRHHLEFTTNIDVTSYKNGVRETLNPEGRAMPPAVWGFYADGCSIRILNPSTYLAGLRQVCATMQEFFHCLVGANVYLTPPNSQGFAPHYDDIEAFVLQVEGRKRWRLYMPVKPTDILARHSSGNFNQSELGEPIFDEVLEAGDVLYFPRGTIHQAITEQNQHSLHITLSVYQQQAYANLLENLMPMVLKNAVENKIALRHGLPLHTWQNLGLANGGGESRSRSTLIQGIQQMVQKYLVPTEEQIDAAVDQLAKKFQHEALPPTILPEERTRTVFGSRSETDAQGQCLCDYEFNQQTSIRLLRANIVRLVAEEGALRLYYYVDNALEYCKYDANFMELDPSEAGAVELLIHTYPAYIKVSDLPLTSSSRRVDVALDLWERGLLMTEKPFK